MRISFDNRRFIKISCPNNAIEEEKTRKLFGKFVIRAIWIILRFISYSKTSNCRIIGCSRGFASQYSPSWHRILFRLHSSFSCLTLSASIATLNNFSTFFAEHVSNWRLRCQTSVTPRMPVYSQIIHFMHRSKGHPDFFNDFHPVLAALRCKSGHWSEQNQYEFLTFEHNSYDGEPMQW